VCDYLFGLFKGLPLIFFLYGEVEVLRQVRQELRDEVIVDEVKQDRLNWIEYDVLGFEYLLYHDHVSLRDVHFLIGQEYVHLSDVPIILSELYLTLYRIYPLVQIILRFSAQYVLSILIFDFEAELLRFVGRAIDNVNLCIPKHYKVEVLFLY